MQPNPLQLLGAVVAAAIVLVALERSEGNRLTWRYSLRSLLIVTTMVAIAFGLVSYAMRLELISPPMLDDVAVFVVLTSIAAATIVLARWINRHS
jgi:hypothetical protein